MSDKVRENRVRRMAERQGIALEKSRRRDPRAWDYGLWNMYTLPERYLILQNVTLDDVEGHLTRTGLNR